MRLPDGLRAVALFEAAKGGLVVLAGFGLLALVHHDLQRVAEHLVAHLHLNPASRYPKIFVDAAAGLGGPHLAVLLAGAAAYAAVRFIEAYGLWNNRRWAQWFAAVSGGVYIPFEIYELATAPGWLPAGALLLNVSVVALVLLALLRTQRGRPT